MFSRKLTPPIPRPSFTKRPHETTFVDWRARKDIWVRASLEGSCLVSLKAWQTMPVPAGVRAVPKAAMTPAVEAVVVVRARMAAGVAGEAVTTALATEVVVALTAEAAAMVAEVVAADV